MDIKFLGTGGAFDVDKRNSACLVSHAGLNFLIDCGNSVFPVLFKHELAGKIDRVLITHMHDDHVGSLSSLIYFKNLILKQDKVRLIYPDPSFRDVLSSWLKYPHGNPEHFVQFEPIGAYPGLGFFDSTSLHVKGMPSYGYYFTEDDKSIVFSGDIGDPNLIFDSIRKLKLPNPTVFHEINFHKEAKAHCYYKDLEPWMDTYEIYGYHCNKQYAPADLKIPLVEDQPDLLI